MTPVHDWTGSRVQAEALTVKCPYCHAEPGQVCQNDGQPLRAFPAHTKRTTHAQETSDA